MRLNRALIVLLVVAIHMLLLSWLWILGHQALPNRLNGQVLRPDRSSSIVFLLEPSAPAAIKLRRDAPHQASHPMPANPERDTVTPTPVYGNEVSNAAALSLATSSSLTTGGTSAEVPKQLGSSLNLTLSPEVLKSLAAPGLAARTPFQARLPATMESKIAEAAAETGPWTEEVIDHDHIRLRRGTTCVTLSRPEIAKIDPFSDSIRRIPWAGSFSQCP
jgi:hypothetical protein